MATVEVKDRVLWTKHIHGDARLRGTIEALAAESTIELNVDGQVGLWRKMKANALTNAATPGLQPIGNAKILWGELFKRSRASGSVLVGLQPVREEVGMQSQFDEQAASYQHEAGVSATDRRAAWEAIKDLWRSGGWRSEAPFGPRDELYER